MTGRPLSEVIGSHAEQIRREAGATADDVATAARKYGVDWTHTRVRRIEKGENALNIESWLVLALALGDVSGTRLTLSDLVLPDPERSAPLEDHLVRLSSSFSVLKSEVSGWFRGDPLEAYGVEVSSPIGWSDASTRVLIHRMRMVDMGLDLPDDEYVNRVSVALQGAGLAEQRLAKKLGVAAGVIAVHSVALWGQGLSAERDRRSGVGASTQKKGRVTRELSAELRRAIEAAMGEAAD